MINKSPIPTFRTYKEAGEYLGKDFRVSKKYEGILFYIDKSLPAPNTIWVTCKICNSKSPKAKARQGYCPSCTAKGLGKKQQGKIISEKYKGKGNPNYIHGQSKAGYLTTKEWRWVRESIGATHCKLTGKNVPLEYHHILPVWFCKIVGIDIFDPLNVIPLCAEYHKVIHHLQLDFELLPILYPLYKKDAHLLQTEFLRLCEVHKVLQFPVNQLQSQDLLEIVRKNPPYKKKLLDRFPEFFEPLLNH